MKGDCERASPSPADKRAPKILTRPRAAGSPGPQRRQEQAVPVVPAEGSPRGWRRIGEQRRMLINYLPRSALANLPPTSLSAPGSRCRSDPRRGNCRLPTSSAFKNPVAGGRAGEGDPSLPSRHPRVQPRPPNTPRGELGGKPGQLTEAFAHPLRSGKRMAGGGWDSAWFCFFGICVWFTQTPGWGEGPWGGGAGCPMGTAQP